MHLGIELTPSCVCVFTWLALWRVYGARFVPLTGPRATECLSGWVIATRILSPRPRQTDFAVIGVDDQVKRLQ